MAPNIKRVFYVNHVSAPIFLEMLAQRPDIQVDKLVNDSPEDEVEPVLARAHAYQIGSARQELARKFHGTTALLERMPEHRGAVHHRCRLRHGQSRGLHQGRRGRGEPGRRQQGRRGRARDGDDAVAVEAPRCWPIIRCAAASNCRGGSSWATTWSAARSASSASAMSARVWRSCAADCSRCGCWPTTRISTEAMVAARGAEKMAMLDDLLRQADYVSINCPHTAETRGMIGARRVSR